MKSYQFQKFTKNLLPYVFFCGLILLFTYGVSFTGEDLSLATRIGEGGFGSYFRETGASGGNYLSAFFGAIMVDIPVLRHILIAGMLATVLITLIQFSGAERPYMYFVILFLGLAAPKAIFAYSFASTVGGATMLIPAFLTVLYLFTVSDLFAYQGKKKAWKIPFLFLNGFVVQMFSEGIGITLLLISLTFLILLWKKHGFSWHLAAHVFGCVIGFTISLILSGNRDTVSHGFFVIVDQMSVALDQLFVNNLLLLGILTLACLMLIRPIRLQRSKNCNLTLFLLLIPMGLFIIFNVINDTMVVFPVLNRILTIVKLLSALAYCWGILRTIQHYVSKDKIIYRVKNSVISVWVLLLVYSLTGTALPNILYIPYLLMIAVTVLILGYSIRHYDHLEKVLRKPLFILSLVGVFVLSFITFANGTYCEVVDTHIRESLEAGTTEITLPDAPYGGRLVSTELSDLSEYYDFPSYGDVEITYVSFADWDWNTYYEAHNVPVIEEYDEEAEKTEDWAYEFEED